MLQYRINRPRTNDMAGLPNTPGLPNIPGLPQDGGLPGSHSKEFKKKKKQLKKVEMKVSRQGAKVAVNKSKKKKKKQSKKGGGRAPVGGEEKKDDPHDLFNQGEHGY